MAIIGISCFYHDSAAAIISDNDEILGAAQEERFSRKKHDSGFPICALNYCIELAKENEEEIEAYVYYEKPIWIFMRLLETYFNTSPRGFSSFLPAMKTWMNKKLFTKKELATSISDLDENFEESKLFFSEHHLSHASSAFFPSPYEESAVLCLDAVGETITTSGWIGKGNRLEPYFHIDFPHSLGMLYSSFTYYCGFKVNSGEYKLMGLAPYGEPKYKELILKNLIHIKDDGSFKLNMKYFKYHRGLRMISSKFIKLFGNKARKPEDKITQFYMDIASSIQEVTEEVILKIASNLRVKTNQKNLCLSGGVALNCVANGMLLEKSGFEKIWVQPASGDAGNALGAALAFRYTSQNKNRVVESSDAMKSAYLGPEFSNTQIENYLKEKLIPYKFYEYNELLKISAKYLSEGKILGWFQGRMEYGPRALGNRTITGDPRLKNMQRDMNLKIKNRESFRPFAPAILDGFQKEYFNIENESPYMLLTRKISEKFQNKTTSKFNGLNKVNEIRSCVPAITHVDMSCRVQTVSKDRNPIFHGLLKEFYDKTKCPILINTSFNIRGEPIVCTPEDALRCFFNTNIDVLCINNFMILKDKTSNSNANFKDLFPEIYTITD